MVVKRIHSIIHLEHHVEQQDSDNRHSRAAASGASALNATRTDITCNT
jgi:hypothetical protein